MDPSHKLDIFSGALRFRTISVQPGMESDLEPFHAMQDYFRDSFAAVHSSLARESVAGASLLYTWPGSDGTLDPILLSAHLDVVPAGNPADWKYPPFSGTVRNGRIWGRGAIDYKIGVVGMLQACEDLLNAGFAPRRTTILAFGHDEEVGGLDGAASIAALLRERGLKLRSVLDEGGYLYSFPWLQTDVAVIGVAEKGYVTLRLSVEGEQGHASTPPTRTSLGLLGESLGLLERSQMPPLLSSPIKELFSRTGHLWREDCLSTVTDRKSCDELALTSAAWADGNSLVRSTTAPTMVSGSSKENILPGYVSALVNFRAVPGNSSADIAEHVRDTVESLGVKVEYEDPRHVFEPSPISPMDTGDYNALAMTIGSVWPGMTTAPGIFPAATDSRHYESISGSVYRFVPVHLGVRGLGALHSINESISIEDYHRAVAFYTEYIRSAAMLDPGGS